MIYNPQHRNKDRAARVSMALLRLAQAIKTINQEESAEFELSPVQIQALLFVQHTREDMATVGNFTKMIGSSHVTAVKVLNGLASKGLIRKIPNPADRRVTRLTLTNNGELAASKLDQWGNTLGQIVETLEEAQLEQLETGLGAIISSLNRQGRLVVAEPCLGCVHFRPHAAEGPSPHFCRLIQKYLTHEASLQECPEHTEAL
ncbi:MarR family transcriptional regulator [Paenibacillus glycanilyticus]|uniref:MarR family winged helix-turn-helix transcriptional regulator n=1 Tax=Paenibacillus glycanilyticus TaxID=126569 RepID=UPI00203B7851|nr:MarR family transcriptional regulator [Paenibacillus glycanilyticus]MCM3627748.1 MarR family transcriptional regulator [Paenibacillus glycanilyticus]